MEEEKNEENKYEIEPSDLKRMYIKKCNSTMKKFCDNKDISQNNSNIKFNQLNVIEKYGILYFYNDSGIYFLDNSKMQKLFENTKDISLSDLFFLKCQNIFKIFLIDEGENTSTYLVLCVKKFQNEENSFLIYIDIENIIEKLSKQINIYDIEKIEKLEEKEKIFKSDVFKRELEELSKNVELNEDGEYGEEIEWEPKIVTRKEKLKIFEEEKKNILEEKDEIFENAYKNPPKYVPSKVIYIENEFLDVIVLDKEKYAILFENGDIIFYKNYEKIRIIEKEAKLMSYNKDTSIFLVLSDDFIYIFKEKDNFNSLKQLNKILLKEIITDEKKEKTIFFENIYHYLIIYTIENNESPTNDDKLYFLEMDNQMESITNKYCEDKYFFPDDYEFDGIPFNSHLKRTIFTFFDKNLGIYMLFNKHMDLLTKYYLFSERKDEENMYDLFSIIIDDIYTIHSRIKWEDKKNEEIKNKKNGEEEEKEEKEEEEEDLVDEDKSNLENKNIFVGMTLINFKFDGYDEDTILVNGEEVKTPYLIIMLGYYGGFTIFYSSNESKELEEKGKTILIKEKGQNFGKVKNISNKVLEFSINEETIELEKEKYRNEAIKKEKNFCEVINLRKVNNRNIFLHELDQQIKENLEYFNNLAIPQGIKKGLKDLKETTEKKEIKDIENSIDNLFNESKKLFEESEKNNQFIDENKKLIEQFKMIEMNFKNNINIIQDNKNKSKELKLSLNSPINEFLTHKKIQKFFGEDEIGKMKNIFGQFKKNNNLYENHTNLIAEMFNINKNLIDKIEECKNIYESIRIKYKYLKNRNDEKETIKNIQNNIFILYMRVFEQYFFDLEQFKNNNLYKENLYLDQLKMIKEEQNNKKEEEKKEEEEENIDYSNSRKRRFNLRIEEDIDEGNNDSISSNEINNEIIISNSSKKISKNNNNNNKEEQKLIKRSQINNLKGFNNNDNYSINEKTNDLINKIFNINLEEGKESLRKNYLVDVLSNFEGRVTYYNNNNEEDFCTDADDLFQEFLEDEDKIKEKELAQKKLKDKQKQEIIKSFQDTISNQKEERKKIEEELTKIEEENKKEIIEKEKENTNLKKKLEELEKKFIDNKNEREIEKKKLEEQIEKNRNEENQKKIDEQKNVDLKIKSLEEQIKNFQDRLKEEERKRIEAEEKNKKLEEEQKKIIQNNNQNNNNNAQNINSNLNLQNNSFSFKNIELNNTKEEEQNNTNANNQSSLFTSNIPNTTDNLFLQKQNSEPDNPPKKEKSIFDSLVGKDTNSLMNQTDSNAQNNNKINNNLFSKITSNINDKNIFKSNNNSNSNSDSNSEPE